MSIFCDLVNADKPRSSSFYASIASLKVGINLVGLNGGLDAYCGIIFSIKGNFAGLLIFFGDFLSPVFFLKNWSGLGI